MAKEIKITMADSEFESLQEAYAKNDESVEKDEVTETYVKGRLVNVLKAKVRKHDEAKQAVSYSTFDPS